MSIRAPLSRCSFFLAAATLLLVAGCGQRQAGPLVKVVKVYDGDTVKISTGEKVRLIGIDCPESHESDKLFRDAKRTGMDVETIKALGKRATAFTRDLVLDREVFLEFDVQSEDKYARRLAYVWIPATPEEADDEHYYISDWWDTAREEEVPYIFLNATIVQNGFAQPMTIPPNTQYEELMRSLYARAREARLGLWSEGAE